jgi:citrate synthase
MKMNKGLEGVVAAETRLSMVDGDAGVLVIGGYDVAELANNATFEEVVWLLWRGALPGSRELETFRDELAARRALPDATLALLRAAAAANIPPMDALLMATPTLPLSSARSNDDDAMTLVGAFPSIVAAYHRLTRGVDPVAPRADLSHAANYLYMLGGEVPDAERVRGIDAYFNTVVDHGLAASTFTARVIVSTESDFIAAIAGALGAMKGPLHGGAPGPALDMVFEIGDASRAESYLRAKIEAGEKLMGFGHRVYKVRDPRADVLAAAAERMYTRAGDMRLYQLAREVEATAIRLLEEYKPGRRLQTNVEFYTALLLHGLGIDVPLFTPTFSIARVAGWLAHCFEQKRDNRIIRPQSVYVGERRRFAA